MKRLSVIMGMLFVLISITAASAASNTIAATDPQEAAALVYVSGYEMDPGVFYPYETGTVTVHVTNAANTSVVLSMPALIEPHIDVLNTDAFNTRTTIGPGATISYSFIVRVDTMDGTYYPLFTVSPQTYGYGIHSTLTLKVDSTNVRATISQKPDNFSLLKKATVNVSVINPRDNDIINVLVVASSPGSDILPQEQYIGTIPANSKAEASFQITPRSQSDVIFNVSYDNGDNHRQTSVVMPLNIGEDKTAVIPLLNDVALAESGGYYTLTGDVSNAGITNAQGMILAVGTPARATEPYPAYAIGSLNANDFSSFTLTFTSSDLAVVPVIIQWKDSDGNSFNVTKNLDLRSLSGSETGSSRSGSTSSGSSSLRISTGSGGPPGGGGMFGLGGSRSGGVSAFYPLIAGGVVLIVAVILWKKRKAIIARFRKQ